MRLAAFALSFLGALSALPFTSAGIIQQPRDLEVAQLFPRSNVNGHHTDINITPDRKTPATVAVLLAQVQADGPPIILGDFLTAKRTEELQKAFEGLGFSGAPGQTAKVIGCDEDPASILIFTGIGPEVNPKELGHASAVGIRAALGTTKKVAILFPTDEHDAVSAVAEGAVSGSYAWDKYKTEKIMRIDCIYIVTKCDPKKVEGAVIVARHVNEARDLANTPPNDLYPESFANLAKELGTAAGMKVDVWDLDRLRADGLNAIVAVGSGSTRPPRLVKLCYTPGGKTKRENWKHVVLVGTGITFDSGGMSAKASEDMWKMKADMAGAAAVLHATLAAAELNLNTRITAWLPMAENVVGGGGMRNGDIITTYDNRTIEVVSTDAEARLLLADSVAIASAQELDILVHISTYTAAGAGGADFGMVAGAHSDVQSASAAGGERFGHLPPSERGNINPGGGSDTQNLPSSDLAQWGSWLEASSLAWMGMAKREASSFVSYARGKMAHVDLGGLGWNSGEPYGIVPSGGTGAGVKTMFGVAERNAV